jgi:DNA helicase-2/ATP-dependent DNA helicase PcrA
VGPILDAVKWVEDNCFANTYILTRRNEAVEDINSNISAKTDDCLKSLYGIDSSSVRVRALHSILMGYKYYEKGYLKDAVREILKPLKYRVGKSVPRLLLRNTAIEIIDDLKRDETRQKSLYEYYCWLSNNILGKHSFQIGPKLTSRASAKSFYDETKVMDLLKFIKIDTKSEDTVRTIHSAKGTEFKNVMVHFEELPDFEKYVFNANTYLDAEKDHARIYYVGFSRAMECLFISVPEIGPDTLQKLEAINIEYELLS